MLYKDTFNKKSNQKNVSIIQDSNLLTKIIQYAAPDKIAVYNFALICLSIFVNTGN